MVILEWTKPGIWIEGIDKDAAWRISRQIECLEGAILEAIVTLNMFDQVQASRQNMERDRGEFEARRKISREVEAELFPDGMMPTGMPNEDFGEEFDKRRLLVDAKVRHQMWQRGFLPQSLLSKPPFIFAKAFIHALDLFDKFLEDIAKDLDAPNSIKDIHRSFRVSLPDLRGIRNSIQHSEDRSKGEHYGKKINLKRVDKSKIGIEGTALVNMALNGNKFGTTMSDGHYGAVDVSVQTIDVLRNTLLEVYSAFEWKGGERLYPS
ncbi:hypothetical protein SAMN05421774_10846 [Gemmobacter megaterium]|uniref:Uncharacterized protein n=1 Tax=Gemmobacter megaterium TaxID=1086013 RepID=A0A1N7QBF6_9RHOB|nr:hypothetical protein [Gemmobacter megaterium]GGE24440.1 hypothetical protein GCM10011345_33010 [Gemmobacter megaterium]SIT19877.1 hypothetical protein SAMN05421774_10846 [Gemmobacter megaterium]